MRLGEDVRVLWLLLAAAFVASWYFVQVRYEAAIRVSYERSEALYRETSADARVLAQAPRLKALEASAVADLSAISHNSSLPATTADLLALLQSSGKTFDTHVIGVEPEEAPSPSDALRAMPLTIRARGTFRHIVRFVEDLSRHSTLISVSNTELDVSSGNPSNGEPLLDGTIHAILYRLQLDDKEFAGAPAP